eukprot:s4052_g1.t1
MVVPVVPAWCESDDRAAWLASSRLAQNPLRSVAVCKLLRAGPRLVTGMLVMAPERRVDPQYGFACEGCEGCLGGSLQVAARLRRDLLRGGMAVCSPPQVNQFQPVLVPLVFNGFHGVSMYFLSFSCHFAPVLLRRRCGKETGPRKNVQAEAGDGVAAESDGGNLPEPLLRRRVSLMSGAMGGAMSGALSGAMSDWIAGEIVKLVLRSS